MALAALLWFIGASLRRGWRVVHQSDPLRAPIGLGLFGALVGATVTMGVERFIGRPLVQLLVVVAAFLVALDLLGESMPASGGTTHAKAPGHYSQAGSTVTTTARSTDNDRQSRT